MQTKAIIMRPDRQNDVVKLRRKDIKGKTFKHGDCMYFLNPDRFMFEPKRILRFGPKRAIAKYYYTQGVPQPLPVPDFQKVISTHKTESGSTVEIRFPKIVNNGTSGEELKALFNPWFYRVIAQIEKPWWKELAMWAALGACAASVYLIYLNSQMKGDIQELRSTIEFLHGISQAGGPP